MHGDRDWPRCCTSTRVQRNISYALDGGAAPAAVVATTAEAPARERQVSAIVWVFGVTLFLSAALLFLVEPMFARIVLPYLGGSPAVWNTCVVFFQAAMLAGYAYAHLLTRHVPLRAQVAIHLTLIAAAALVLPVAVGVTRGSGLRTRLALPAALGPPTGSVPHLARGRARAR